MTPLYGIGLREVDYPDSTMLAAGPICRKSEDLIPLLKVFIGTNVYKLKLDEPVNLKNLRVFYQQSSDDIRASKVNGTMRAALMTAVKHFKELTGSATQVTYIFNLLILQYRNTKYHIKNSAMNRMCF